MSINSVTMVGRLTKDAELKYTGDGLAITKFNIAVDRYAGKDKPKEASFFTWTLFGKRAEGLTPYLLRGTQVALSGDARQNRWEKDGEKHSRIEFVANEVELLGGGKKTDKPSAPDDNFQDDIPF